MKDNKPLYPRNASNTFPQKLRPVVDRIAETTFLTEQQAAVVVADELGHSHDEISNMINIQKENSIRGYIRRAWTKRLKAESTVSLFRQIQDGEFLEYFKEEFGDGETQKDQPTVRSLHMESTGGSEDIEGGSFDIEGMKNYFKKNPLEDISLVMRRFSVDDRDVVKKARRKAWEEMGFIDTP